MICNSCDQPVKAKGLCSKHYQRLKATYFNRKCQCGNSLPKYAHKYCHSCAEANRVQTARRAKLKYRTKLEWIPMRDKRNIEENIDCPICGLGINYSLRWPHLMSPSIEHIIPLSRGGNNSLQNMTHSHLWCNIKRKNNIKMIHGEKVRITPKTVDKMREQKISILPIVLDGIKLAAVTDDIIEDYIRLRKAEEDA